MVVVWWSWWWNVGVDFCHTHRSAHCADQKQRNPPSHGANFDDSGSYFDGLKLRTIGVDLR